MDRTEAHQIIRTIAQGEDPYSGGQYSRNRPENNPETIQALCIVLAELVTSQSRDREIEPAVAAANIADNDEGPDLDLFKARPLGDYLNNLEKEAILRALEHTDFNKTRAAELLGLTFRQLRYKLDVHDLPRTRSASKPAECLKRGLLGQQR